MFPNMYIFFIADLPITLLLYNWNKTLFIFVYTLVFQHIFVYILGNEETQRDIDDEDLYSSRKQYNGLIAQAHLSMLVSSSSMISFD